MTKQTHETRLDCDELHWHCPPEHLGFETTAEVDTNKRIVGQPTAWDALKFGLECDARGQNVYIRGGRGTGRMSMVRALLEELQPPARKKQDRCYVSNFSQPEQPRLITLDAGKARDFRRRLRGLADYIGEDLPKAMDSEPLVAQRTVVQERAQQNIRDITGPLEEDLRKADMTLVSLQNGAVTQTLIFPIVEGKPTPPEQFFKLVDEGTIPPERKEQYEKDIPEFQKTLLRISRDVNEEYAKAGKELSVINENAVRELLANLTSSIANEFSSDAVACFLNEIIDDVVDTRLRPAEGLPDPHVRYGVNVLVENDPDVKAPVVEENTPSLINLLGTVEGQWTPQGPAPADYRGIRAGALLRADGGFLILDVNDVLAEPGAWRAITRTLRNNRLEIVPPELGFLRPTLFIKPEPIDISVRVILVGDNATYYRLDYLDPDFKDQFKVLADFDAHLPRDDVGVGQYVSAISQIIEEDCLRHFSCEAVAALIEHGARIASQANKLTAQFGRVADIAREASFVAAGENAEFVQQVHVENAIRRTKERASLPSRRFQDLVNKGTIRINTSGLIVGQINGLAVINAGPLTYGFPARITATIGAGRAGIINIEGQASMSGSIHTKGFHILGGLLRYLLKTEHPLAFSASIAFEQSYGGIDGDSASGAETCCLLSALTDIPINQNYAMTGAIDQFGHIQAIGGVNEKIEGFFDACSYSGLNGEQGVVIPKSNASDLMLRQDVVDACKREEFHIYAVENVLQALEILTGMSAGTRSEEGYPDDTLLHLAVEKASLYWRNTLQSPKQLTTVVDEDGEADSEQDAGIDTVGDR